MSRPRTELHELLCSALGSRNVYFQPPDNLKMKYPAIVYSLDDIDTDRADNLVYLHTKQYSIILVEKNPESEVIDKLIRFPMCQFDRSYVVDNLYHYVFSLYF